MHLLSALILSLTFSLSLPAFAQHESHNASQAATKRGPLTDGLIKKVDPTLGEVVIQHGQLDSIGMPPMTMAFGVADKSWLNKLKAGDKVRFAAEMKAGNAIISRYEMLK